MVFKCINFLVEEHLSRKILDTIAKVGQFNEKPGTGITFQVGLEDAVGVDHQFNQLSAQVEGEL